jgi:hypothetical protein
MSVAGLEDVMRCSAPFHELRPRIATQGNVANLLEAKLRLRQVAPSVNTPANPLSIKTDGLNHFGNLLVLHCTLG